MTSANPIFLDRKGRRSRITNVILGTSGALAIVGACVVSIGVMFGPELPRLRALQFPRHNGNAQIDRPSHSLSGPPIATWRLKNEFDRRSPLLRFAYASPNDLGSMASLQLHAEKLDAVILDCLELNRGSDRIHMEFVKECKPHFSWLADSAPNVQVYPMLSDVNAQAPFGLAVGYKPELLIQEVTRFLQEYKAAGIVIDTKSIPATSHRNLIAFLYELRTRLVAEKRSLILIIDATRPSSHLQQLARTADYIIVDTYDQTLERSEAGPVAAQGWFDSRLSEITAKLDRNKLIIGIGSFGYEWKQGIKRPVSVQHVWDKIALFGGPIKFDARSMNPAFQYYDNNVRNDIWYLDGVTAFNQMRSALSVRPAGVAVWKMGLEDPGVWSFIKRDRFPDDEAIHALSQIKVGGGAFANVRSPLLAIGSNQNGKRELSYNQGNGLITNEVLTSIPLQTDIIPLHSKENRDVALTFDDGPSAKYTEKILDILREKSVKATFYLIGTNSLKYPHILRRIYAEGHDIGNHSFSHPNFFIASKTRIAAELNATQRVFEANLGVRTILLRPPYTGSNYWRLDEAPILVQIASELGYVFGGWDADTIDYMPISPQVMVQRTIAEVEDGGRIILLHDAGGKRDNTIAALPFLIDELQARNFRFVTTGELVGMPRDVIMPPVKSIMGGLESTVRRASFEVLRSIDDILPIVGISTAILGTFRVSLIGIGAFLHRRRERAQPQRKRTVADKITVLVPAYNEEKVICKTVDTLLASTIADRLEIMVIDDGSTDATTAVVRENYGTYSQVKVHKKPNGGKASALNYGIQLAETDIIVAIDGDTMLLPDAIEILTNRMVDDASIGAVAGSVLVGNATSLMTRFQALEYITSQNMDRRAFELINAIGVVPGCIGAWRKQALVEVGGFSTDTLAEDADLTISIERRGWCVVSEAGAVALTEAPESLRGFMKQRFRWTFGMLQVACKHAGALRNLNGISLVVLNIFFFQIALALFAPLFDGMLLYSILGMTLGFDAEGLMKLVAYWLIFQTIDLAATSVGLMINGEKAPWRLLPLLLVQRFSYRQLLYVVTIRAVLAAIKGRFIGWGKLIRTGTVAICNRRAS